MYKLEQTSKFRVNLWLTSYLVHLCAIYFS